MRKLVIVAALVLIAIAGAGCDPGTTRADRYLVGNLAEKYTRQGDRLAADYRPAEALLAYRQAALADATYAPGLQRLAGAYAAQGQKRMAAALYQRLLTGKPTPDMERLARRELARLHVQLGMRSEAERDLQALAAAGDAAATQALSNLAASPPVSATIPVVWQRHLDLEDETLPGENVPAGLALSGKTLYVTAQEGMLYALDAATGSELWRYSTGSTGSKRRVTSAPVAAGDLVLFGADDNVVRAVDAGTGRLRWKYEAGAQVFGAPYVDGDAVYLSAADGSLAALTLRDGSRRWLRNLGAASHTSPMASNGAVFVGAQDMQLHAVAASDGSELWTFLTAGKVESVPSASGGTVYFGSGDSRIYALDARDGSMLWYYSTGDAIYSQPLVKGNVVYAASMGSLLAALMADSGGLLWEYYSDTPLRFAPVLSGGRLYLAPASDPWLYAIDAAGGSVAGKQDLGEWPACQPVAANGLLYVAQRESTVLALRIGP